MRPKARLIRPFQESYESIVDSFRSCHRRPLAAEPPHDYPIRAVPFTKVHVADEFWSPRLETNRKVTIPLRLQDVRGHRPHRQLRLRRKTQSWQVSAATTSMTPTSTRSSKALRTPWRSSPTPKLDAYLDDVIAKIAAATGARWLPLHRAHALRAGLHAAGRKRAMVRPRRRT